MYNNNYIILNVVVYFQQYLFTIHKYKFMLYKYSRFTIFIKFSINLKEVKIRLRITKVNNGPDFTVKVKQMFDAVSH